jgi:hypothetical protein
MKEEAKFLGLFGSWYVALAVVFALIGIGYMWIYSRAQYEIHRVSPQRIQSVNEELLRLKTSWAQSDEAGKNAIANQACRVRLSIDRQNVDSSLAVWISEVC